MCVVIVGFVIENNNSMCLRSPLVLFVAVFKKMKFPVPSGSYRLL